MMGGVVSGVVCVWSLWGGLRADCSLHLHASEPAPVLSVSIRPLHKHAAGAAMTEAVRNGATVHGMRYGRYMWFHRPSPHR